MVISLHSLVTMYSEQFFVLLTLHWYQTTTWPEVKCFSLKIRGMIHCHWMKQERSPWQKQAVDYIPEKPFLLGNLLSREARSDASTAQMFHPEITIQRNCCISKSFICCIAADRDCEVWSSAFSAVLISRFDRQRAAFVNVFITLQKCRRE